MPPGTPRKKNPAGQDSFSFVVCYLSAVNFFITNRVPRVRTMPTPREITTFCTNPATIKLINEITATVTA